MVIWLEHFYCIGLSLLLFWQIQRPIKKTISSFFLLILRKRSDYDHMKNIFYNKDFSRLHLTFPMTFKDIILAIIDGNN